MSFELYTHSHKHIQNKDQFELLHKKKSILVIDRFVLVIGTLSPLTSLPQIFQILETRSADGVSTITWLLWTTLGIFWLIYGIAHREKPIIINNFLWVILELIIVVLSIIY